MSGEIPSLVDLQNTKVRIDHFAELIDGTPSGTSTNPVTGVTHPTYEKAIKDLGFKPAPFNFVTGGTLGVADADKCIYNPAPAGDNNWYSWSGALPHTVAPGTDPTAVSGFVMRSDSGLRSELAGGDGSSIQIKRPANSTDETFPNPLNFYFKSAPINLKEALPGNFVTDGSVDYSTYVQKVCD